MNADTDRRLEAALSYARRGLRLLPIAPGSKAPHASALAAVHGSAQWGPLARVAATEPEISAWFDHDHATGVGIITGSGLVVADFDRSPVGVSHPATPTVKTARGHHLYLGADCSVPTSRQPWGDVKGEGGYVVAPLSRHPNGHCYSWAIGLDDAPLAPLSSLRGGNLEVEATPPGLHPEAVHMQLPPGLPAVRGDLAELAADESAVLAALPVLGIAARLGSSFRCVLPGHGEERPSASVFRDPRTGMYKYHDWHRASPTGREWWTLADVRASRSAGQEVRLRGPSASRWYRRMFWEAGVIEIAARALPALPSTTRPVLRRVAKGFSLLLALRDVRDPGEPAPYSRDFAAAWCGVTPQQARDAITELRRLDVLRVAGTYRQGARITPLYEMGPGPARPRLVTSAHRGAAAAPADFSLARSASAAAAQVRAAPERQRGPGRRPAPVGG